MNEVNPADFIITRKRKKYKFALFHNSPICFEAEQWDTSYTPDVLEMGAGTGLFSVELAKRYPERKFVAVDVKADRLQTGARKASEEGLANIRFLRARADQLSELIGAGSLEKIWVTFPDPFPKKGSSGRRLTHPRFLKLYANLLINDGALFFKTDAHALFEWSLEQLVAEHWLVEELSFDLHEANLTAEYKINTTYEARFIGESLNINFVKALPKR